MDKKHDGLSVTVNQGGGSGDFFGKFYPGEIEEDTWHRARLVKIVEGKKGGGKYPEVPAWVWVYQLIDSEFTYEDEESGEDKQYIVREKTSQKVTTPPRASRAYERYSQLIGREPEVGEDIDLRDLFGTDCKLMITNTRGDKLIFHNIEKVSVKGVRNRREESGEETPAEKKSKKKDKKKPKKKTAKKESEPEKEDTGEKGAEPEDDDDLFSELF